jgi:hypothetical protein
MILSEAAKQILPSPLGSSGKQAAEESPRNMFIEGQELREIIRRTTNVIEVKNEFGRVARRLSSAEALALDLDLFVGIGNLRRIRFLRRRTQKFTLNAGSRTTQRLRGEAGVNIAHPLVREHRPVRGIER